MRSEYKKRTGVKPSADTLQELLIAFMHRSQDERDLQPDRFRLTIWRAVGDVIVQRIQDDSDRREEMDAAQTYGMLKSQRHLDDDGVIRNCLVPTHVKTRSANGRDEASQATLNRIWSQLGREQDGLIEIFRAKDTNDVHFA